MDELLAYRLGMKRGGGGGSTGGGTEAPVDSVVREKDVNFYDYDGSLLYSYTLAEANALTALPDLPTRNGLTCQGWNQTLETVQAATKPIDVGATYITDDGKTRLLVSIGVTKTINLKFTQTMLAGVTVEWGDGSSSTSSASVTSAGLSHTYAATGNYVISINVANGCELGLGHGTSDAMLVSAGKLSLVAAFIGKGVSAVSKYAFYTCGSLRHVTIPNTVTIVDSYAFHGCGALLCAIIPQSTTSISTNAFYQCFILKPILHDGIMSIGTSAFHTNMKGIASIPKGIKAIPENAFYYNYTLKRAVIPEGVTNVGKSAFLSCHFVEELVLPETLTSIGDTAFNGLRRVQNVKVPKNVTSIGSNAFYNCCSVEVFDFSACTSVPTLGSTGAFQNLSDFCVIKVPVSLLSTWKAATNWSTYANYMVGV